MRVHVHHFATMAEAAAFAYGVDTYSKDGIAACWLEGQDGPAFRVAVHDYRPIGPDGEPFDDPFDVARVVLPDLSVGDDICPICGSSDHAEVEGVFDA